MTQKEKAKELVAKMLLDYDMPYGLAQECAIIAIDEIIRVLVELSEGEFTFIHNVEYWQEVKNEINKL